MLTAVVMISKPSPLAAKGRFVKKLVSRGPVRICVFCGSTCGNGECYVSAAYEMGKLMAERGIELVYGGGRVGLMGALADSVLTGGGTVIGVIPQSLVEKEIQHSGLSALHIVGSMHERKDKMAALADGFIALPGGAGTLEEIFEQWTWAQLGIHNKPCGFLNTSDYFGPLRMMIDTMVQQGFLKPEYAAMLLFDTRPAAIVDKFQAYSAPSPKWMISAGQTDPTRRTIRIVAALVQDKARRVLLVRKKGTRAFMQPGGKLRNSESHLAALQRELCEELGCFVQLDNSEYLGMFTAPAANENGYLVEAALYRVTLPGSIEAAAEIEELAWLDPYNPAQIELAPLTREFVLPLARR
jgi:uncharacterized protein (TIGR00730 family)